MSERYVVADPAGLLWIAGSDPSAKERRVAGAVLLSDLHEKGELLSKSLDDFLATAERLAKEYGTEERFRIASLDWFKFDLGEDE